MSLMMKTIAEINRVLKPGGKFIVTTPNKLFPFETHGLRIGNKIYGSSGFGFPFIPWLPEFSRRYVANAKVYTPHGLKNILLRNGFIICDINFIGHSLDVLTNSRDYSMCLLLIFLIKLKDSLIKNYLPL